MKIFFNLLIWFLVSLLLLITCGETTGGWQCIDLFIKAVFLFLFGSVIQGLFIYFQHYRPATVVLVGTIVLATTTLAYAL